MLHTVPDYHFITIIEQLYLCIAAENKSMCFFYGAAGVQRNYRLICPQYEFITGNADKCKGDAQMIFNGIKILFCFYNHLMAVNITNLQTGNERVGNIVNLPDKPEHINPV